MWGKKLWDVSECSQKNIMQMFSITCPFCLINKIPPAFLAVLKKTVYIKQRGLAEVTILPVYVDHIILLEYNEKKAEHGIWEVLSSALVLHP